MRKKKGEKKSEWDPLTTVSRCILLSTEGGEGLAGASKKVFKRGKPGGRQKEGYDYC